MYKDDTMLCKLLKTEYCDQKHILEYQHLLDCLETDDIQKVVYKDILHKNLTKQERQLPCPALHPARNKKEQTSMSAPGAEPNHLSTYV